ncbi:MAG: ABC transporter substrate binding protein [Pseudomonadota bacterium]
MVLIGLMWLVPALCAAADDPARAIAVVYPDIGEPYRGVFTAIIEGIEDRTKSRVTSFAVGPNANGQELSGELRRRDIRVVIALGRNGLKATSQLDRTVSVVAGGVLSVPEPEAQGLAVLSLAPDPALLFAKLKTFMPSAKRVIVVYDPYQNGWLIRLAREAAKAQGLELLALEANDLKSAMRQYQEALTTSDAKRDALWLPQDSTTVEDSAVLPLVLREAWNQNLALFSSSVAHVKRGALFALYPDNVELGRALAGWAIGLGSSGNTAALGVQALKDVLLAVNTRTANHLGINLDTKQQRFNMVFPEH